MLFFTRSLKNTTAYKVKGITIRSSKHDSSQITTCCRKVSNPVDTQYELYGKKVGPRTRIQEAHTGLFHKVFLQQHLLNKCPWVKRSGFALKQP